MTKHEWHDRAPDGEQIFYRATHHASRWEFYFTRKSDPEWEKCDMLPLPVMEQFREVLWNKHLRRRVPLRLVEHIDRIIEELRADADAGEEE